jgi:hypothetical protein
VATKALQSTAQGRGVSDGVFRLLLAVVGATMAIGSGCAVVLAGGWSIGLAPFATLGAWLLVLSAFFERVDGPTRYFGLRMTIRSGQR